ncbi:MAG: DNA repair protein RecO [Clostridiaceae bacterium]|nr:DNA repair protein RecO [Clostridiaceae bacterium]
MALIKTKGLIIKEIIYNDTDKMLTLLSLDYGRISVYAKNSRKGGSRSSFGTQILTYGEYVLFRGRDSFILNSCDVIANFYELSSDIEYFTYAAHLIDMAADACNDTACAKEIIKVLLHGLNSLKKKRNPKLISSALAIKLTHVLGYPPHISDCAICNTKEIEKIHFSFEKCGFICENCATFENDSVHIENGIAKAIIYVLCAEGSGIFNFELSDRILEKFFILATKYIEGRMDRRYKKLDFLKEIDSTYIYKPRS